MKSTKHFFFIKKNTIQTIKSTAFKNILDISSHKILVKKGKSSKRLLHNTYKENS